MIWGEGVAAALAGTHRARARPGTVPDPADRPEHPQPAIRGVPSAFSRGLVVTLPDAVDLATGWLDEDLSVTTCADCCCSTGRATAGPSGSRMLVANPPWCHHRLPSFFAVGPLPLRLREEDPGPQPVVLRPGADWISSLRAIGPGEVVRDAVRRLRAAGVTEPVDGDVVARGSADPDRLAAALLLRLAPAARVHALSRIAVLPRQNPTHADASAPEDEGSAA